MSEKFIGAYITEFEFKQSNRNISVENGHEFVKNLKKEARRQKAMQNAEDLVSQTLPVEFLPTVESRQEEIELSETFEIIEE